jgi:hypothetical protein
MSREKAKAGGPALLLDFSGPIHDKGCPILIFFALFAKRKGGNPCR